MQNDNTIFLVGSILIVTLISICSGLRKKQIEVDSVIKEHKSHKKSDIEIPAQNNNLSDESPFDKAEMSETFDPELLIDWNLLQNYSDHLGSWISQFELVIDIVSLPIFASMISHTLIAKLYPGQFPNLRYYAFFGSLPLNLPLKSMTSASAYISDKKYIDQLTNLVMDSNNRNPLLTSLEIKLISSMKESTRKVKFEQYKLIKQYVKDQQISYESLLNVYMYVLNLEQFGTIKRSESLTDSEAKLARIIEKMLSYVIIFVDNKEK